MKHKGGFSGKKMGGDCMVPLDEGHIKIGDGFFGRF